MSRDEKSLQQTSGRRQMQVRIAVVLTAIVLGLLTFLTISQHKHIASLLLWINDHPGIGFFIFGATYVWFTVLFLPPAILALAAGAVFGLVWGVILVWGSAITGETLAFLLGRFLFRDIISQRAKHYPTWQALEAALKDDGWKLVALLRLAPVLPFTLVNYALGVSGLPFWHYFWPSAIGVLPGIIMFVYLGTLAKNLTELLQQDGMEATPKTTQITFFVLSGVSCMVALAAAAFYAKKVLSRRLKQIREQEEGAPDVEVSTAAKSEQQPLIIERLSMRT